MQVEKIKITPAMAREWLVLAPEYQRKINQAAVDAIASAISSGGWRENGATIVFNIKGELIDGQHRLLAIIAANRSVYSLVANRIDSTDATFQTIDDSKSRTISDFLKCTNRNHIAAIARFYWNVHNGRIVYSPERPPIAGAIKLLQPHIQIIEPRCGIVQKAARVTGVGTFLGFLDFYYLVFLSVAQSDIDVFWERLADGMDLKPGSPVAALRNRCIKLGPNERIARVSMMALVIKSLNAFLSGESISRLSFDPGKEEFPQMAFTKRRKPNAA